MLLVDEEFSNSQFNASVPFSHCLSAPMVFPMKIHPISSNVPRSGVAKEGGIKEWNWNETCPISFVLSSSEIFTAWCVSWWSDFMSKERESDFIPFDTFCHFPNRPLHAAFAFSTLNTDWNLHICHVVEISFTKHNFTMFTFGAPSVCFCSLFRFYQMLTAAPHSCRQAWMKLRKIFIFSTKHERRRRRKFFSVHWKMRSRIRLKFRIIYENLLTHNLSCSASESFERWWWQR